MFLLFSADFRNPLFSSPLPVLAMDSLTPIAGSEGHPPPLLQIVAKQRKFAADNKRNDKSFFCRKRFEGEEQRRGRREG